jgi:hypothetical protein
MSEETQDGHRGVYEYTPTILTVAVLAAVIGSVVGGWFNGDGRYVPTHGNGGALFRFDTRTGEHSLSKRR